MKKRWIWIGALLLAMAAIQAWNITRAIEAFLFIGDVAAGSGPSRLKSQSAAPVRETISYQRSGEPRRADLYRPGAGEIARAIVVVVPGVVRLGKDDPRIVAFAESMARARFLVFVPDLQSLRDLTIRSEDVEELSELVSQIAANETPAKENCIGIVAFSYAAGPAILAAMTPKARSLIRFVYAIGAYYDIEAVGTYLTTGYFREGPNKEWQSRTPSSYATWVFVHSVAAWLEDLEDRRLLQAIAETKLADPGVDIGEAASRLGPEGRAVFRLLLNKDPEIAPRLISELPPRLLAELRRLDLRSKDMADLKARLILIHGRDDYLIPYSESMALAAAADGKAQLFVIGRLAHVELTSGGIYGLWKLWRASYLLFSERDAMPRPAGRGLATQL